MTLTTYLGFDNRMVKLWLRFQALRRGCQLLCGPYAWDLTRGSRAIRISRNQFNSIPQLASNFDDLFDALEPAHAGNSSLLDFSRLQVHTYRDGGLKFELAQWPVADAPIEAYFEDYQLQAEDLIFDVGAEYGISTYLLSQVAKRVVAFEQHASLRPILARNVERHALANVTVARDNVASLTALISLYGQPAFCRINLDQIHSKFLLSDSAWTSYQICLAARSKSKRVLVQFAAFLQSAGFTTTVDHELGLIWARPGYLMPPAPLDP